MHIKHRGVVILKVPGDVRGTVGWDSMERAYEGTVTGRVQGVGFRYFTREVAEELGLRGWVRNLPDGGVAFHAEGPERDVEVLVERLRQGPLCGRVDRLVGSWLPTTDGYQRFEIRG